MTNEALQLWLVGIGWGGLSIGVGLFIVARRRARLWRVLARLVAGVLLALALTCLWYRYRPRPTPRTWQPHPAVTVSVRTLDTPRPTVISGAVVDLSHPGLEIITSQPRDDGRFEARTTQAFVEATDVALGINAHFFTPFTSNHPLDFYPREGDPVRAIGFAAADGVVHTSKLWRGAVIYFGDDGRASVTPPVDGVWDAVGGRNILVTDGKVAPLTDRGTAPRVGLGIADDGLTLVTAVVDGRQPGYSEGMSLPELAALMIEMGAHDAIELDGGGSATLAVAGDGGAEVINCPIHTRIPGRQRPVASHLGVRFSR